MPARARYLARLRALAVALVFAPVLPAATGAQPAGATPTPIVAVIDVDGIMRDAAAVRSARMQLEEISAGVQRGLTAEENKLRQREQELQQQRAILAPEAFGRRRQEIQRDIAILQQKARAARQAMDRGFKETMTRIQLVLFDEVGKLAKEKGLNLVLRRNQIVVARDEFDLTPQIRERLDKRLPDVKLKLETVPGEPPKR